MTAPRTPVKIHLRSLPAAAGLFWIRRGFRAFARRPAGFMGLFGLVLLMIGVMKILPPAVQIVLLTLMPLLSLGFMLATADVLDDLPIRPGVFWRPMTTGPQARRALINIGLVYLVVLLLIAFFGDRIDGGEFLRWMDAMSKPTPDGKMPVLTPLSGWATVVLLLNMFGVAIVSIPLWHAPALVHWGRHGAAQAMFSSIVAIWRTRAAFVAYILGWCAVGLLFLLATTLLAVLVDNVTLAALLMLPVGWALSAIFYITIWFGFVDTFAITASPPADTPR
jgi:hypothetical protein